MWLSFPGAELSSAPVLKKVRLIPRSPALGMMRRLARPLRALGLGLLFIGFSPFASLLGCPGVVPDTLAGSEPAILQASGCLASRVKFRNDSESLFENGDYKTLMTLADRRLAECPSEALALWWKAKLFALDGQWDPALEAIDRAMLLNPEWGHYYLQPLRAEIKYQRSLKGDVSGDKSGVTVNGVASRWLVSKGIPIRAQIIPTLVFAISVVIFFFLWFRRIVGTLDEEASRDLTKARMSIAETSMVFLLMTLYGITTGGMVQVLLFILLVIHFITTNHGFFRRLNDLGYSPIFVSKMKFLNYSQGLYALYICDLWKYWNQLHQGW